ncbi:hypothetical protein OPT61_g9405 [Boeremia exigua]|uniref:Uncharacterized protein n=1 Tax=Boeremia exigua TaxID=749465 RepID=A0ACC2HU85_9PLEO|nr:hypothetical protein OPT61_g9405 [Boeremia exigua]
MYKYTSLLALLQLLPSGITHASPSASRKTVESRQLNLGTLFGPITLPPVQISNISLTLFNFGDEVFDISSISIFGDINDGGECNEAEDAPADPETRPGDTVVLGPAILPAAISVTNVQVTLFNFADEVFDISSISIFGDINDGTCTAAE